MPHKSMYETGDVETTQLGGKHSKITTAPSLIPAYAILEMGRVLKGGAEKYGIDNWKSIPVRDHIDHLLKHVYEFLESNDPEDLAHAACRAVFLVDLTHERGRDE